MRSEPPHSFGPEHASGPLPPRPAPTRVLAVAAACLCAVAAHAQSQLQLGPERVTIADAGVVLGVGERGLENLGGPAVVLDADSAEWLGIAYDKAGERVELVVAGARPDASPRARIPIVPRMLHADAASVVSGGEFEGLRLESTFRVDPLGPYLLCDVVLENRGTLPLTDLVLTREWSAPGPGWTFPPDVPRLPAAGAGVRRLATSFPRLDAGASVSVAYAYALAGRRPGTTESAVQAIDVPLTKWTSAYWPNGLVVGGANGVTLGDYDADGWVDLFALEGGWLFRNIGGLDWVRIANLEPLMPPADRRYGGPFGDYDNDGLPDIFCEPRWGLQDTCHHLLRNLGGGPNFVDVATDPSIMGLQACGADGETACILDVDGDGNLDIFLPVYPPFTGGVGNFFWHNLGSTGPDGAYRFEEVSGPAGLDNIQGAARPEGAQALDTDFDGDVDIYAAGRLYMNASGRGVPRFRALPPSSSGIAFGDQLEEGIVFSDVDLDGDLDMIGCWISGSIGIRVLLAAGDGSYVLAPQGLIDSSFIGNKLGVSSEDWDNDGDMDLTTREVFRRNQLMETGNLHFTVATHAMDPADLVSAMPAWGDVDRDGDLDCALGNWLDEGSYYANTLYGASTPDDQRRYVRVRVVRDAPGLPAGLETEYGASVEVRVDGEEHVRRRRKFVSSSAGYLSQSEYTLHFALPADPFPADPARDVVFDVSVDLPGVVSQGLQRVDRHVNPVLGGVRLADLDQREIVVFRSGTVLLDGVRFAPEESPGPGFELKAPSRVTRTTTTGGLVRPTPDFAVPPTSAAPGPDHFVGIEFDTLASTKPVRLTELIVDGELDLPVSCAAHSGNVFLWNVSSAGAPVVAGGGAVTGTTFGGNDRSYVALDAALPPGRVYRLVARVERLRGTPITAPVTSGPLRVTGGLSFQDASPCSGAAVDSAQVDPGQVFLAVRFQEQPGSAFQGLGHATSGAAGKPVLRGVGGSQPSAPLQLALEGAAANASVALVFGRSPDAADAYGGTLVPSLNVKLAGLTSDASGALAWSGPWPMGVPVGSTLYVQALVVDPSGPAGFALSNALAVTAQP